MNSNDPLGHGAQEDAGAALCLAAAKAAGKTAEQADNCEDGEHRCPTCPWAKPAKYAHGDPCPECHQPMFYDPGHQATREEPGEEPCIYCTDCGLTQDVDWVRQSAA